VKYSVITFGCRVNQADSLGFEGALRARGATAEAPERADVVIVNTCSVTASADQAARQAVRRVGRINPRAQIVVTGCSAARRPEDFEGLPNVLRVVRNDDKPRLVESLSADLGLTTAERFGDGDGGCGAQIEPGMAGRTAFTLRVQTGCAQPCAYCIIPTTRGKPRSVPIADLLVEIDRIVAAGFKEIALTGVHLGSYGRDLDPASSLIDLLGTIERRYGSPSSGAGAHSVRFRVSSLEPMDCTPEIVDLVASSDLIAPHFHLPLQHASDRVLAAMRRPYTSAFYARLAETIHRRIPNASIGSDVIVGFPGETDEDFEALCDYLPHLPLTHLHVFPYSERPGTAASMAPNKVSGAVIRDRAARIREISGRLTTTFRENQRGTTHRALTIDDGSIAVTGNYLKVAIPPGRVRNEWITLRIVDASAMRGEAVDA